MKKCSICGNEYKGLPSSRFCSEECRVSQLPRGKCKQCNKEFVMTTPDKTFCSVDCTTKWLKENTIYREKLNARNVENCFVQKFMDRTVQILGAQYNVEMRGKQTES